MHPPPQTAVNDGVIAMVELRRKRVFRKGWSCQFVEEHMKTPLPRTLTFVEDRKIWEMAKRGGFTLNIAGRQELEAALRKGVGGIWLDLTREQYAKLRQL